MINLDPIKEGAEAATQAINSFREATGEPSRDTFRGLLTEVRSLLEEGRLVEAQEALQKRIEERHSQQEAYVLLAVFAAITHPSYGVKDRFNMGGWLCDTLLKGVSE